MTTTIRWLILVAAVCWPQIPAHAADPAVIGKTLRVGIDQLTVIGVLPPSFDRTLIWYTCGFLRPLTLWPPFADQRRDKWFSMMARLKPGVSRTAAQAELTTIAARLASVSHSQHLPVYDDGCAGYVLLVLVAVTFVFVAFKFVPKSGGTVACAIYPA